jgi:hypothetical protein
MPQLQLPLFADGLTPINEDLAFQRQDGQVVYYHGLMPVFQQGERDLKSFRMFTSPLIANGTARQRDIVPALGVPLGETIHEGASRTRDSGFFPAAAAAVSERVDAASETAGTGIVGRRRKRAKGEPRGRCSGPHLAPSDSRRPASRI